MRNGRPNCKSSCRLRPLRRSLRPLQRLPRRRPQPHPRLQAERPPPPPRRCPRLLLRLSPKRLSPSRPRRLRLRRRRPTRSGGSQAGPAAARAHARPAAGHARALFSAYVCAAPLRLRAEALRPVAREAKLAPPSPPIPAPPFAPAPAHAPAAEASRSEGLGPEPAAGVAPESLAQLAGAWTQYAADCNKLFQRRGSTVAHRQPVEEFAQAATIQSQRIRLQTGVCRLERASREGGALEVSGECQDSIS